ncbi:MAG: four helix bundle protein [Candidatus Marinimicrobia bacterium]|nr:four helix bundle protein [Candidatus Neomarinimicrobiota bacterium]
MTTFKQFEDLEVWQKSRILTTHIYRVTNNGQYSCDCGLRDQTSSCSVSIMANIAEGFGRESSKEFANFLIYSHGSASELQSHLYIALDLDYIDNKIFNKLYDQIERISKMTLKLQNYSRRS